MPLPAGLDALWGYAAEPRRARALLELINFDPARGDAGGGRGAATRATLAQPRYRELFPAPRQRWVDDLALHARGARARSPRRSCWSTARRTTSCRCATASCRCCEAAARRPRPRLRPLRPRLAARAHRRVQPPGDHVPGDRPMTDFAVLRAPSQVLFGAGMAAAAGRVAAELRAPRARHHRPDDRRGRRASPPSSTRSPALEVTVFADAAVDVPRSSRRRGASRRAEALAPT